LLCEFLLTWDAFKCGFSSSDALGTQKHSNHIIAKTISNEIKYDRIKDTLN
jgi:hypothetical protein